MPASAIELQGVVKYFDRFLAVAGLDLTIKAGELFGFLGPNGAGKTTSLLCIVGLLKPNKGKVIIFGHDMAKEPLLCKKRLAFIPDQPFLYEKLTGLEFLCFLDELYEKDKKTRVTRAMELLERFSLKDFASELLEGYSHGMKQRLVFAGALIHDPDLLIVDEPMVGLDPQGARLVKTVFTELCQKGKTVVLSTHTLQLAEAMCDRVAIINHGTIAGLGTIAELRQKVSGAGSSDLEDIFLTLTREGVAQ